MTTYKTKLTTAGILLGASSLASAHAGNHTTVALYHYLTSPDHVALFTALALTALGMGMLRAFARRQEQRSKND